MNWFVVFCALELGLIRGDSIGQLAPYTELTVGSRIADVVSVETSIRTLQDRLDYAFAPFRADYSVSLQVELGNLIVGVEHSCTHDVLSTLAPQARGPFGDWEERLFIRYETLRR